MTSREVAVAALVTSAIDGEHIPEMMRGLSRVAVTDAIVKLGAEVRELRALVESVYAVADGCHEVRAAFEKHAHAMGGRS